MMIVDHTEQHLVVSVHAIRDRSHIMGCSCNIGELVDEGKYNILSWNNFVKIPTLGIVCAKKPYWG